VDAILESFASQRDKHRFTADTFMALLRIRGLESVAPHGLAEGFYGRKLVIRFVRVLPRPRSGARPAGRTRRRDDRAPRFMGWRTARPVPRNQSNFKENWHDSNVRVWFRHLPRTTPQPAGGTPAATRLVTAS
jgi:hypothetical protein